MPQRTQNSRSVPKNRAAHYDFTAAGIEKLQR